MNGAELFAKELYEIYGELKEKYKYIEHIGELDYNKYKTWKEIAQEVLPPEKYKMWLHFIEKQTNSERDSLGLTAVVGHVNYTDNI